MKYLIKTSIPFISLLFILTFCKITFCQKYQFLKNEEGVLLTYGGQKLYFYQSATKSIDNKYPRSNYIHPLYGIEGEVLTEDFPDDHLHHRGIFWAWHQFYVRNQKVGDPWECRDIMWDISNIETSSSGQTAILKITLFWNGILPGSDTMLQQKLLKEETTITYRYQSKNLRELDFKINLTALHEGTAIGGSEDHKGYSGFSVRSRLPQDLEFFSSDGEVKPEETAIDAGGWIDMRGTFDPDKDEQTQITIMCNPNEPQPFHGWILRDQGSMQNAAFPGREPVSIPTGETISLKYKLILHSSEIKTEDIQSIYSEFIN